MRLRGRFLEIYVVLPTPDVGDRRYRVDSYTHGGNMKFIAAAIASILISVIAPGCASATGASQDEPTRVMIVGDSVTQGALGHHTWRYFFAQTAEGVDFVGNKRGTFSIYGGNWDYRGENAYAVDGWDSDHAAVWGGSMTNPDPEPKLYQLPIGELSATYQPDVIVSAWGINDLNSGVTPTALVDYYEGWIAAARAEQPDVDFVISELAWTWASLGTRATDFNALLDALAEQESTDASRVVIARMGEPYTKDGDTYDGVHPNRQGEEKIARMIGEAYAEVAPVDPEPVATPEPAPVNTPAPTPVAPVAATPVQTVTEVVTPVAPRRVRAVRDSKRVVVTWRAADSVRVKCATRSVKATGHKAVLRSSAGRCKVRTIGDAGRSPWVAVKVKRQR